MAQFKNNNFQRDTHEEHTLRVEMFLEGVGEFEVELDFRGTLVADIQDHLDIWKPLVIMAEDEWGDAMAATGLINHVGAELEGAIVAGRFLINSMLQEEGVEGIAEHDIIRDFGAEGKIPDDIEKLMARGRQMAATNVRYIDEGNPYALPTAQFEEIGTLAEELHDALEARKKEHREAIRAGRMKELERRRGDRLLSRGYRWTAAIWGIDDDRLLLLGFVPKSQIWTEGMPEPGPGVNWPDVPTGVGIKLVKLGDNEFFVISADEYTGNTGFDVRVAWGETGGAMPVMPGENTLTDVPFAIHYDCEIEHGMTIYVWVRARNGEEVTDWADVASLDVPGPVPIVP